MRLYNLSTFNTKSVRKIVREWIKDTNIRSIIVQNTKLRRYANEKWAQEWFKEHGVSKQIDYSGTYYSRSHRLGPKNGITFYFYSRAKMIEGPIIVARVSHLDYLPPILLHELKHHQGIEHRDMDYEDEIALKTQADMLINLGRMVYLNKESVHSIF